MCRYVRRYTCRLELLFEGSPAWSIISVPTVPQIIFEDSLAQKVLGSMVDVVIGKGGHEVVTVIVVGLHSKVDTLVVA